MSILVQCSQCDRAHRVHDRMAGRRLNCPGCGVSLLVPESSPTQTDDAAVTDSTGDAAPEETAPVEVETVEVETVEGVPVDVEPVVEAEVTDAERPEPPPVDLAARAGSAPFARSSAQTLQQPPSTQSPTVLDELEEDDELPRRKPREDEELDMTPMVDVTFLLLIFFMVTASFSLQKSIQMPRQQTDAPSTSAQEKDPEQLDPVELEIDEFGGFLVLAPDWERETPGKQNLTTALKDAAGAHPDNKKLHIKVHELAKLQSLVDGMDAGAIAGFTELQVTQVDGF